MTLERKRGSRCRPGEGHEAAVYKPASADNTLLYVLLGSFKSKVSAGYRDVFTISGEESFEVWTSIELNSELSIMNKTVKITETI